MAKLCRNILFQNNKRLSVYRNTTYFAVMTNMLSKASGLLLLGFFFTLDFQFI